MKTLILILTCLFSLNLYGQEKVTNVLSSSTYDFIRFSTLDDKHYVSTISEDSILNVYEIDKFSNAHHLLRKESTFLNFNEDYFHNHLYIYTKYNEEQHEKDIFLFNFLTGDNTKLDIDLELDLYGTSINENYIILTCAESTYVLDINTKELISEFESKHILVAFDHIAYYSDVEDPYGFNLLNIRNGSTSTQELSNINNIRYEGQLLNNNSDLILIDTEDMSDTIIWADLPSKITFHSTYNDKALFSHFDNNGTKQFKTFCFTTKKINAHQRIEKETYRLLVDENTHFAVSPTATKTINIINNSTIHSINKTNWREFKTFDDNLLIAIKDSSAIVNPFNGKSLSFDEKINGFEWMKFTENQYLIQVTTDYGSKLYHFNNNNYTLEPYTKVETTLYGLRSNSLSIKADNSIYIMDEHLHFINSSGEYSTCTEEQFHWDRKLNIHYHPFFYENPAESPIWSETINDSVVLFETKDNFKKILASIKKSDIMTTGPYSKIQAHWHNEKLYIVFGSNIDHSLYQYHENELQLTRYVDGRITMNHSINILGSDDQFLYFSNPQLSALDIDNNIIEFGDYNNHYSSNNDRVITFDGETYLLGYNEFYRIKNNETIELIDNTDRKWVYYINANEIILYSNGVIPDLYTLKKGEVELHNFNTGNRVKGTNEFLVIGENNHCANDISIYNRSEEELATDIFGDKWIIKVLSIFKQGDDIYTLTLVNNEECQPYNEIQKFNNSFENSTTIKTFNSEKRFSNFHFTGNIGLLMEEDSIYVSDSSFDFMPLELTNDDNNKRPYRIGQYIYFFGMDKSQKKQMYRISDLSQVMVNTTDYDQATNTLKIYPNPAQEYIQLEGINEHASYSIYDINGKRIVHSTMKQSQISISQLSAGTYFIHVMDGETISVGKVIVVR